MKKAEQARRGEQGKSSTVREFILLTLIHAEIRDSIRREIIIDRIKELFQCRSIVIATEKHQNEEGKHYHVGIWNSDASKNTLRDKLRKEFKEWEGRAIDISLHKGWGSICSYILKEDKEPLVWGEFTLDQIKAIAHAHEAKKETNLEVGNLALLKKLEQLEDWYQVYRDDILANKVLSNLSRMKEAYEDLKVLKDIETNVFHKIIDYLQEKGNPKEYDIEQIREKYLVIDWVACQLCFKRPIKTKQLFIYGEPSTQKTLLMSFLSKVIRIYFASSRRNDFTGANDHYDLWVFDEFHEQEISEHEGQMKTEEKRGTTTEGSAFVNNLLKVLDGQECRLDSKYSRVFKKKKNTPIIMIANKLPKVMEHHGPFRARFYRVRFSNQIQNLEEERVIATFWGCLVRRASNSPYAKERQTPNEVTLNYNGSSAFIINIPMHEKNKEKQEEEDTDRVGQIKQWKKDITTLKNPLRKEKNEDIKRLMEKETMIITKEGEFYKLKPKTIKINKGYHILIWEILKLEEEPWENNENKINLIHFANIPIKKKERENQKEKSPLKRMFEQLENKRKKKQEEKEEEEEEEDKKNNEHESITRLCNIFLDKQERKWIRRNQRADFIKIGHIQNEEVWSVISLQRAKTQKEQDYATWPLEIKIFENDSIGCLTKENGIKIFPAVLRNVRRGGDEEKRIQQLYEKAKDIIENIRESQKVAVVAGEAIKCEVSIARNGEKQTWNNEC